MLKSREFMNLRRLASCVHQSCRIRPCGPELVIATAIGPCSSRTSVSSKSQTRNTPFFSTWATCLAASSRHELHFSRGSTRGRPGRSAWRLIGSPCEDFAATDALLVRSAGRATHLQARPRRRLPPTKPAVDPRRANQREAARARTARAARSGS